MEWAMKTGERSARFQRRNDRRAGETSLCKSDSPAVRQQEDMSGVAVITTFQDGPTADDRTLIACEMK
jgi:hypothetical protein